MRRKQLRCIRNNSFGMTGFSLVVDWKSLQDIEEYIGRDIIFICFMLAMLTMPRYARKKLPVYNDMKMPELEALYLQESTSSHKASQKSSQVSLRSCRSHCRNSCTSRGGPQIPWSRIVRWIHAKK